MLSDEQLAQLQSRMEASAVRSALLKDDLLDHFCCFIEEQMKQGVPFEAAQMIAWQQICPNGLDEIQREADFMLNASQILLRKRLLYTTGVLSTISLSLGTLCKLLYWPAGGALFIYGLFAFVLLFLPMLAVEWVRSADERTRAERLKGGLGFGSALLLGLAVLFKTMHLQGAPTLLLLGTLLFSFGFLPLLFFRMYQKSFQ